MSHISRKQFRRRRVNQASHIEKEAHYKRPMADLFASLAYGLDFSFRKLMQMPIMKRGLKHYIPSQFANWARTLPAAIGTLSFGAFTPVITYRKPRTS